ncbi:MAG: class I SAM-dependent methyltransferase [Ginsengibacter sp.]
MYSSFQLARKFLIYYLTANNGKGHGIHSPFVFNFVTDVLNDKNQYECFDKIEPLRKELQRDHSFIEVEDFGAGSAVIPHRQRKVSAIAASSLKNKKFARLLFRIVKHYQPETIIELGTSFGTTTCYLACAKSSAKVFTLEGSKAIAQIAKGNFEKLSFSNIQLIEGNFEESLPELIQKIERIDILFVDGNHRREATLKYFNQCLGKSTSSSIFIFDDIHWSKEMEDAWEEIKAHPSVKLTIDLFFIGLVFFNPDFKVKQHFVIRF